MNRYKIINPCLERKLLLSGEEVTFQCDLVELCEEYGILLYFIKKEYRVSTITLKPGMYTYAFYWIDKYFTLYKWFEKDGTLMGDYFNLADSVQLSKDEFFWRDLIVDILVLPTGNIRILDEDEVPESIDGKLLDYINNGKEYILKNYQTIIRETEDFMRLYSLSL